MLMIIFAIPNHLILFNVMRRDRQGITIPIHFTLGIWIPFRVPARVIKLFRLRFFFNSGFRLQEISSSRNKKKPLWSQVKWKGDHHISPPHPFRHLIWTSMFTIPVIFFLMRLRKKQKTFSNSCNISFPIPMPNPTQKVSVFRFRFRDNGNCYFRFRLKICSGSFTICNVPN